MFEREGEGKGASGHGVLSQGNRQRLKENQGLGGEKKIKSRK